jgi:hypothetical protein
MTEDDVFAGFTWAVPKAFGAAVHACRFEQGDVLYSERSAYEETGRAKRPARYYIQVLDPPRTTRALGGDGEGQRFFSNWESPVDFEWMDRQEDRCTTMRSSQGGLFTCLWKGDVESLREEGLAELPRPLLLRDLQPRVAGCLEPMLEQFKGPESGKKRSRGSSAVRMLFICAIDQSSDASRVKRQSILRALDARFPVESRHCSPTDLDLSEAECFHPALGIFGVAAETRDTAKVEAALREVLYSGGKVAGGKGAGQEGGRFQLARHGTLAEMP